MIEILFSLFLAHGGFSMDEYRDPRAFSLEWAICDEPGLQICLGDWTPIIERLCGFDCWKREEDGGVTKEWCCRAALATPTPAMVTWTTDPLGEIGPPKMSWLSVRTRDMNNVLLDWVTCEGQGDSEPCDPDQDGTSEMLDACCNGQDDDDDGTVDEGCVASEDYLPWDPSSGHCRIEGGVVRCYEGWPPSEVPCE